MKHTVVSAIVLNIISCPLLSPGPAAGSSLLLKTADGQFSIEASESAFLFSGLDVLKGESRTPWIDAGPRIPIWTATVQDFEGNRFALTALDKGAEIEGASNEGMVVTWKDMNPGNIDVRMTLSVRDADIVCGLAVDVKSDRYALWNTTFPEIGPLASAGEVQSILPKGWGVLRGGLMDRPLHDSVYPSGGAFALPFVAVSDGETGIYVGVEDPAGYAMRFFVGRRDDVEAVSLGVRHDVEGMGEARKFETPYDIVVTPYHGSWYEAARLYREAAKKTEWGNVPPLSDRADIPQWMKDTDLWFIGSCDDENSADQVLKFAEYFEVPTSAHVYTWHQIPFDDHYPEYFPAKPGFNDAVAKVQDAGVPVMPYINGRLWDSRTDSWREKNAASWCSHDVNGNPYIEVYGNGVPLSPMCPSTQLWQETVTNLVDRLVNEVGVSGVYIDQISAAAAKRCFAGDHGHPKGGGTYWIQGYRELLRKCRAVLRPETGLTTEENSDPWNDQLHAFLMVNTRPHGGDIVPIYPAVYGGRVISFGFQYFHGEDFKHRYPLRIKFAQTFTFGSQMGWIGSQILGDENEAEADYLKRLCHARHASRDALQYGELLAPVEIGDCGTVSWEEEEGEEKRKFAQPAVWASAWLTPEGERKVAITNVADDPRTVTIGLDQRHIGSFKGKALRLLQVGGAVTVDLNPEDSGLYRGGMTLEPLGAMVLEIEGM